jgi:hypothetical protein
MSGVAAGNVNGTCVGLLRSIVAGIDGKADVIRGVGRGEPMRLGALAARRLWRSSNPADTN